MNYVKPQSPIRKGNTGIYPLTVYDQIIMKDGTRFNGINPEASSNHTFEMPVGYIFDWAPVEGNDLDLSTPEKVANYFGYGVWKELNGIFTFGRKDGYEIGSTGGEEKHSLTSNENGRHSHIMTNKGGNVSSGGSFYGLSNYNNGNAPSTNLLGTLESGEGEPHNNMPPFLVVYKWQRIS